MLKLMSNRWFKLKKTKTSAYLPSPSERILSTSSQLVLRESFPFAWIKNYMISHLKTRTPFRIKMDEEVFITELKPILHCFGLDLSHTSSMQGYSIIEYNPVTSDIPETIDISSDLEGIRHFMQEKIQNNCPFKVIMKEKHFDENYSRLINELRAWGLVSFDEEIVTIQQG